MIEKHAFIMLLRASRGDAAVLLATFLLTVFRDLTEGIVVGFGLGSVLFIHRMSKTTEIATHVPFVPEDRADSANGDRAPYDETSSVDPNVVVYRISGAFFFGAAASIGSVLEHKADTHRALIIDFTAVPFLDSTAANILQSLARKARKRGVAVVLTGTSHEIRKELFMHGIKVPLVSYDQTIEQALTNVRRAPSQPG